MIPIKDNYLIQTISICRQDIGMEFSNEKNTVLIMKSRKRQTVEEMELPNWESIRMFTE